ncbi:MAG: FHA domain-containing protein [Phycisphaeraceae bacterium]|nr:MAG: FHA domain-containing protein [Phycisphaeraceae bacterium]
MDFVLVRVQSDGRSTPAVIKRGRTMIGRQDGCQLRIRSGEVSRKHCEIRVEEGAAVVKDRGSRNGTFVNGVKIVEKRLAAGDLLAVGPVIFLVQLGGQPAQFDAAEMYREGVPGGVSKTPASAGGDASSDDIPPTAAGLLDDLDIGGASPDDSSVVEFEFDFEDEEEEQRSQPPL